VRSMSLSSAIDEIKHMNVAELQARYVEVFGERTRSRHRQFLIKRIAWRLQAQLEGDLSARARRRAMELADDADLRVRAPAVPDSSEATEEDISVHARFSPGPDDRLPMPGSTITRQYKGKTLLVRVLQRGFEYEGEVYKSLSAVAKAVTGSHWNGFHFFNVNPAAKNGAQS